MPDQRVILLWKGQIKIIDFPQSVCADENRNAFQLLLRDLQNICEYFSKYGIQKSPVDLALGLWQRHSII